jgi:peptide/nickel transport system ATP-binding protein
MSARLRSRMASEVPSPVRPVGDPPRRLLLRDVGGGHLVAENAP